LQKVAHDIVRTPRQNLTSSLFVLSSPAELTAAGFDALHQLNRPGLLAGPDRPISRLYCELTGDGTIVP